MFGTRYISINRLGRWQSRRLLPRHRRLWNELDQLCYDIGQSDFTRVFFDSYTHEPLIHEDTRDEIRTMMARLVRQGVGEARLIYHSGVYGRYLYTGYDDPELQDFFEVRRYGRPRLFRRRWVYRDYIRRVDKGDPGFKAWWVVDPLKNCLWDAYVAKLIGGRPLVRRQLGAAEAVLWFFDVADAEEAYDLALSLEGFGAELVNWAGIEPAVLVTENTNLPGVRFLLTTRPYQLRREAAVPYDQVIRQTV